MRRLSIPKGARKSGRFVHRGKKYSYYHPSSGSTMVLLPHRGEPAILYSIPRPNGGRTVLMRPSERPQPGAPKFAGKAAKVTDSGLLAIYRRWGPQFKETLPARTPARRMARADGKTFRIVFAQPRGQKIRISANGISPSQTALLPNQELSAHIRIGGRLIKVGVMPSHRRAFLKALAKRGTKPL